MKEKIDKESKKKIKSLKNEEKYEDIFNEFGKNIYLKYVPEKYKRQDKKKLKKERKYEDIYNKYGKSEYDKILIQAMYNEIKEEKGTIKAFLWKIKQKLVNATKFTMLTIGGVTSSTVISTETIKQINGVIYKDEIDEYNDNIEEYAKQVKSMNLSDIQIFMKVMDDMWGSIKGYATPKKDIRGYLELDLATEDGYGVCRNMASDVAKKLNEINPKYNARTLIVYVSEGGDYEIANINTKMYNPEQEDNNSLIYKNINDSNNKIETSEILGSIVGNHLVTLVDIPEDNLIMVLDPTNPGIGIYINGKVIMLNYDKENVANYEARKYVDFTILKGLEGCEDVLLDYIKSFEEPNLTFEEIENKYGLEAQNRALTQVRTRKIVEKMNVDEKEDFKETIKVSTSHKGPIMPTDLSANSSNQITPTDLSTNDREK